MASIKSYTTKSGDKRYSIQLYAGINPQTGKPKRIHRKGFRTQKEATLAASRLELELATGDLHQDNNILFEEVYREWYESYINTVRESTTLEYQGCSIIIFYQLLVRNAFGLSPSQTFRQRLTAGLKRSR